MTNQQITELIGYINLRWEHAPLSVNVFPVWQEDLASVNAEAAAEAVKSWARSGEKFPPTSGWVYAEATRGAQTALPPFAEVGEAMMRAQHWLPYNPSGQYTAEDTANAVAVLMARGVHEVILRFVAQEGLRAVLTMPWPDRHALDPGQAADHRDMARAFRARAVPDWQSDPRPGVALQRAARAAGVDDAALLASAQARVERPAVRPALPAPDPVEDGPFIDPADVVDLFRRDRAKARAAEDAARAAAERATAADVEAQRAALAELEAHGRESA